MNSDKKGKKVQQHPEDPHKQNKQQEREYREQKEGNDKVPDQKRKEEAIEDYKDIEKKGPRKNLEEE